VNLTYGSSPSSYNNGRLITMTDGVGSENYTYNNLGLLKQLDKLIDVTTYTTKYSYNIASQLTQITYPSNRVVQQSVDAIGRLCEIAPSTTGCGTAASPFATGFGYSAAGQLTGLKYGNAIYASFGFSVDRLQLNCLDYSTTNRNGACVHDSTTKFGLTYSYGSAGSNNSLISSITDSVDNGRTATYTYDAIYRLTRAVTTGSTGYPAWGLSESYDRYGNRSAQSVYSGCTGISCPTNSVSPDTATNRISGDCYDFNGNLLAESAPPCPSPTYTYDGENHMVNYMSASPTYVYDGNGLRVKKCVPNCTSPTSYTTYVFSGSKVIAEYDNGAAVGSPSREYIYAGGALLAKIDSSGTKYYHQDQLSNRLVTDSSGNPFAQMGHFPYGESWYNATNDKLLFTSYERDSESGNDYAQARYNMSRLARFSSPDPIPGNAGDPQSLNRYSYVRNTPVIFTDPSGLQPCLVEYHDRSTSEQSSSGVGPSNASLSEDSGQPEPQFQSTWCGPGGGGGWWGGGVTLDGGYITDNSGSEGAGFPIGGGDALAIIDAALTPTDYTRNIDKSPGCQYYFDDHACKPDSWSPVFGNIGLLGLLGGGPDHGGGGGGNTSGSGPKLRPRTNQEYQACIDKAAATRSSSILAARSSQVVGGLSIELAIFANAQALPALNQVFIAPLKEGGVEATAAVFDLGHAGAFAYAGSLATFVPGYLYVRGTIDVAKAYDQYNVAVTNCAGAVPK
jgi:RHS repeat-associated protein